MTAYRRQRGSGTLLIGLVVLAMAVLAVGVGVWARVSIAEHRAAALADLTALDAAAVVRDGGDGCADAARRLAGGGAATGRLVGCRQRGDRVDMVVGLDVPLGTWGHVPVRVAAEAGTGTGQGPPRQ